MTKRSADPHGAEDAPAERVVARLRSNGRALFWPTLLLFAICGATGYFAGTLPEKWQNTAFLVFMAALVFLLWLLPLLVWLAQRYTITTRRVIVRTGFFVRTRQEILHSRGYEVSVRKGWLQSMLGSGDVRISVGQGQPIVLRDVPSATLVGQTLHDLVEQAQAAEKRAAERRLADSGE